VADILNSSLSKLDKRRAFAKLRNLGIVSRNKNILESGSLQLEKIKQSSEATVHCDVCHGSYSQKYFHRHKKTCCDSAVGMKAQVLIEKKDAFIDVLNRFQDNDVGAVCRTDTAVKGYGRHLWQKDAARIDKSDETRKSVMADMRNLAHLYILFRNLLSGSQSSLDMLDRRNWSHLKDSILEMTVKDDHTVKYGLKNTIYYLLLRFADWRIGELLSQEECQEPVTEVNAFITLLKHHQNSLFGDAKYLINKARQENLRLPSRLPSEADIGQLRDQSLKAIKRITSSGILDKSGYVELRNWVCSRLTLFNARRGGEPSRLKVSHWTERHKWIPSDLSPDEKEAFNTMTVMYGTGKGNHLVSTIGELLHIMKLRL
jgi:hypothetical protein